MRNAVRLRHKSQPPRDDISKIPCAGENGGAISNRVRGLALFTGG